MSLRQPALNCSFFIEKQTGKDFIVGLDEAGRGPLAGSVVAAAVCFSKAVWDSEEEWIQQIQDSKKLSEKKREELFDIIQQRAEWFEIVEVTADLVDRFNILRASLLAMAQCLQVAQEKKRPMEYALIDGNQPVKTSLPQRTVVQGDQFSKSIAAASILAKVFRDRQMKQFDQEFPQYGFAKHKGYGTKAHWAALEEYGPCPIHRKTFLSRLVRKATGTEFENKIRERYEQRGFQIIEQNWRGESAEIDLVVRKGNQLRFVEVRYREDNRLEMAFPKSKQDQVKKAARLYLTQNPDSQLFKKHYDFALCSGERTQVFEDVFSF